MTTNTTADDLCRIRLSVERTVPIYGRWVSRADVLRYATDGLYNRAESLDKTYTWDELAQLVKQEMDKVPELFTMSQLELAARDTGRALALADHWGIAEEALANGGPGAALAELRKAAAIDPDASTPRGQNFRTLARRLENLLD